ncbi:hypothetical protein F3523_05670 [Campylobacter upsaliensis]|nr:hypothetical protein [Campylobacter upsaliensis]EAJ7828028.1 hypothetical protein [Campylobacter upsaliensis]EAK1171316.1 hypothetical protein [Campylobacter upsaliensis]EAL3927093.1 hypothetical protein [Campylobacter upsaliensis]ECW8267828.1 hypothetical protein [Campylobacter upsaliensis]
MNEDKNTQRKDGNHNFIYENDILEIYGTYKNQKIKILARVIFLKGQKDKSNPNPFYILDKFGLYPLKLTNTSAFTKLGNIEDENLKEEFKKDFLSLEKNERMLLIKQNGYLKAYNEYLKTYESEEE